MRVVARTLATLRFAMVSAGQNFWRNLAISMAAVCVMCLILLMLGATLLLTHMSDQVLEYEQVRASNIKIYLLDGSSQAQVAHFQQRLKSDARVSSIAFETKEQAAEDYKQRGLGDPFTVLNSNPLPASFNLALHKLEDLGAIDNEVKSVLLVDRSEHDTATNYNPEVTDRLQSITKYFKIGGIVLGGVLAFITVVIIMVTIRTAVAIRQREIEIMKLVGATDWFVRLPFIIEGVLSGMLAAVLAGGIVAGLYRPAISASRSALLFFPFTYDTAYLGFILLMLFAVGAVLGAFGSFLGVRRFLAI